MSAVFVSGSSTRLVNSAPPVTGYPCTVGMWHLASVALSGSSKCFWSLTDGNGYFIIFWSNGSSAVAIQAYDGVGPFETTVAGTLTANVWYYVLVRFISSTNRRLSVLLPDGSVAHAAGTTAVTLPTATSMSIGCANNGPTLLWDGNVAEMFVTGTDIVPDNGQTPEWLIRQLAYRGPFSVPYIRKDILDYQSLRSSFEGGRVGEAFSGVKGKQIWAKTNAVTLGAHPPLLGGYKTFPGVRAAPAIPF